VAHSHIGSEATCHQPTNLAGLHGKTSQQNWELFSSGLYVFDLCRQ
jgi:hypothetical protein